MIVILTVYIQYGAKVMQTKFDEFRSSFSQTFAHIEAKSFTLKRYFKRYFVEILHNIPESQTKNRYYENLQK